MANLVSDYLAHGWKIVPIPPGSKGPNHPGWNTQFASLQSAEKLPPGYGVGLLHAYSGTMAFDIDDWDRTVARGIDLDALYNAPDAVIISSGRRGRGKLLYKMPFGLVLPTKKFQDDIGRDPNTNKIIKVNVFELRCATLEDTSVQDVLPPSIHPDTGLPYQWAGAGHWSRLPMLPPILYELWMAALADIRPPSANGVDSSWDEIRQALAYINPDCCREEWISVGMALQWAGEQTFNPDQAFLIWNGWSRQGTKYDGEVKTAQQWVSFRTKKTRLITLGTLFHIASSYGWTRPAIDASVLFSDVTKMVKPADVINTLRPLPPDLDLSLWPTALTDRALEVSKTIGCDPLVPLFAGLGALCGAVDARTRLELVPGFKVPPVLWLMTIGDPGDMKSPGSHPMIDPLTNIELADRQRFVQDLRTWEIKEAAYASAYKDLMAFAGRPEALLPGGMEQAPTVPEKPEMPVPLKIKVSDVTSQKLIRLAAERPRGLLCHLDEMNSWVYKVVNAGTGEDRSAWVVGYEAKRYEMDRVAAGSIYCDNFAVSIYGNMQPQVLEENFSRLTQDGLLQRFLPAVLRHDQTKLGQPIPDVISQSAAWENTLRLTFALEPKTYKLSSDAYQAFRRFQQWYYDRVQSERLANTSAEFMTAFGKIVGLAGRLILMFHILEAPFADAVSVDIVDRVVRIVREYVVPTYRFVFDKDGSTTEFDMWIVEWVIQHADAEKITLAEIKRSARRPFEKANLKTTWQQNEWVIGAMHLLEKMHWVHRTDDGSQESRSVAEWLVNPHLKTMFKDYREAVVRAKLEWNEHRIAKARSHHPVYVHGMDMLEDRV